MSNYSNQDEVLQARAATDEEKYYYEQAYKEPVQSIARIEEVAKFLVGATATTSGLFVAAYTLAVGKDTVEGLIWFLPFIAWSLGILCQLLVLFPERYRVGRNQPASWRAAFLRARAYKYGFLLAGGTFFVAGLLLASVPLYGR
ncbi:MAG: hypothetical protein U9Q81_01030 [Pseudomonadota bacterium]|nr:hypothetical protein [Pseudomonadota bacterium]